ncbi:transcriptional regulator, LuxR family [Actinobacteria bacterium OK074]|nr:transcriptional regulator, LuxR family [Actinobacteria bacterium OK074]
MRASRQTHRAGLGPYQGSRGTPAPLAVAAPAHEAPEHCCAALSEQLHAELVSGANQLRSALALIQSILDSGSPTAPAPYPLRHFDAAVDQVCRQALDQLTPREFEVLLSIGGGMSNRRAASVLHISEKTVKNHLSAVFSKLGAADRTQAVVIAIRGGAIALAESSLSA